MNERHLYLYAYDLPDDRRRARLLEMSQRFAVGGQRSAYECWWSPEEAAAVRTFTTNHINTDEDAVLIVRLDPRAAVRCLGRAEPPSDPDVFIFG
ncbi:MAG: CRISPR-associated endonuclease Cas2 [Casimicrobiaceae bacterium]|nr:CRISPR-associated endonuclease Cas2 [Casimicrobiaceae bacterium]MCX8097790.1 CRISPR-associated endonuclease Cas2 [Casimicrobiaceae bacterium]MDW8313268.1 CRISPR-associated endonuclease Cas2 [Burkholderiales bacterium]